MRKFGFGFLMAAFAVMVIGCSKDQGTGPTVAVNNQGAETTGGTSGSAQNPNNDPELQPGTGDAPKDPHVTNPGEAPEAVVHPKGMFDIKAPKADGWAASANAATLGDKMDDALATVKEALVAVNMNYDNAGNKLTGKAELKIRNSRQFRLEYYKPETEASVTRVIADGKERVQTESGKATKLPAFREPAKVTMTEKELDEWAENFTEEMFNNYREDDRIWSSLVSAWRSGVGGYKTSIEEKTMSPAGKPRKYYRVVAKTDKNRPTDIEIMVDGVRFLPVAVRVIRKNADGTLRRGTWSAEWKFGGTHSSNDFKVPKAP